MFLNRHLDPGDFQFFVIVVGAQGAFWGLMIGLIAGAGLAGLDARIPPS
jgi:hypothetical protein